MMKNAKLLFLLFPALLLNSCRVAHAPPSFTLCTALENVGVKYCANDAIPDLKNGKEMPIKAGDIVMPIESFNSFYKWGTDLRQDLIRCENQSSR
jgi:hypothetical protein